MSITKLSPNWACQMGPIHCPKFLLSGMSQNRTHSVQQVCQVDNEVQKAMKTDEMDEEYAFVLEEQRLKKLPYAQVVINGFPVHRAEIWIEFSAPCAPLFRFWDHNIGYRNVHAIRYKRIFFMDCRDAGRFVRCGFGYVDHFRNSSADSSCSAHSPCCRASVWLRICGPAHSYTAAHSPCP